MGVSKHIDDYHIIFDVDGTPTQIDDDTAPGILTYSIEQTVDGLSDRASFSVWNVAGARKTLVDQGDTVDVFEQWDGEGSKTRKWRGKVDNILFDGFGGSGTNVITITCIDFVYWTLINEVQDIDVTATKPGQIIKDAIDAISGAPIDTTNIDVSIGTATDYKKEGITILQLIEDLRENLNANFWSEVPNLAFFKTRASVNSNVTLTTSEIGGDFKATKDGSTILNDVTVNGSVEVSNFQSQETQTATATITSSTRKTVKLTVGAGVDEIPRADVFLDNSVQTGTENYIARLQQDNGAGTAPIAESDSTQDIASVLLPHAFAAAGGFATFLFPRHQLDAVEREYWLIMETDGAVGEDVGTDGSGNLVYKVFAKTRIAATATDATSITAFGVRKHVVDDPSINTTTWAQSIADGFVAKWKDPFKTLKFTAIEDTPWDIELGEYATVTLANADISSLAMTLVKRARTVLPGSPNMMLQLTLTSGDAPIESGSAVVMRNDQRLGSVEKQTAETAAALSELDSHGSELHAEVWDRIPIPIEPYNAAGSTLTRGGAGIGYVDSNTSTGFWRVPFPQHPLLDATDPELLIAITTNAGGSGDFFITVKVEATADGESATSPPDAPLNTTQTITPSTASGILKEFAFALDRTLLASNDWLFITVTRIGGNVSDTRIGTMFVTGMYIRFRTKKMGEEV